MAFRHIKGVPCGLGGAPALFLLGPRTLIHDRSDGILMEPVALTRCAVTRAKHPRTAAAWICWPSQRGDGRIKLAPDDRAKCLASLYPVTRPSPLPMFAMLAGIAGYLAGALCILLTLAYIAAWCALRRQRAAHGPFSLDVFRRLTPDGSKMLETRGGLRLRCVCSDGKCASDAPLLLLVHGFMGCAETWQLITPLHCEYPGLKSSQSTSQPSPATSQRGSRNQ